jgi:hypothetical protein
MDDTLYEQNTILNSLNTTDEERGSAPARRNDGEGDRTSQQEEQLMNIEIFIKIITGKFINRYLDPKYKDTSRYTYTISVDKDKRKAYFDGLKIFMEDESDYILCGRDIVPKLYIDAIEDAYSHSLKLLPPP